MSKAGGGANFDRKNMRKRLFATSPYLDTMLTNPLDGKTRSILAKKHEIDCNLNYLRECNCYRDY